TRVFDYVVVGAGSAGSGGGGRVLGGPCGLGGPVGGGGGGTGKGGFPPRGLPPPCQKPFGAGFSHRTRAGAGRAVGVSPPRAGGRMLGGSSSMNAMIYVRGNPADYDAWAAGGAHGWSYREVLPYFLRSEDNQRGPDDYHGIGGPLHVSDPRYLSRVVDAFLESAVDAGHKAHRALNRAGPSGGGRFPVTQYQRNRGETEDRHP